LDAPAEPLEWEPGNAIQYLTTQKGRTDVGESQLGHGQPACQWTITGLRTGLGSYRIIDGLPEALLATDIPAFCCCGSGMENPVQKFELPKKEARNEAVTGRYYFNIHVKFAKNGNERLYEKDV